MIHSQEYISLIDSTKRTPLMHIARILIAYLYLSKSLSKFIQTLYRISAKIFPIVANNVVPLLNGNVYDARGSENYWDDFSFRSTNMHQQFNYSDWNSENIVLRYEPSIIVIWVLIDCIFYIEKQLRST